MQRSEKHLGETTLRRFSIALGLTIALYGASTVVQAQDFLTHHIYPEIANGSVAYVRPMLATKVLRLDIVLPLRDQEGLDSFVKELYNPASPFYRKFLTVSEFTDRFGPSQEDYDTVIHFAKDHGFKVVGGSRDGMDIQIEGSVANIEKTFNISMQMFKDDKENRTFYAPDREPTVDLPFPLWHISGLDNYSIPHPQYKKRDKELVEPWAITGSGPLNSFLGSDMRAAYYGVNGTLTGAGQHLGLLEYAGTDLIDLYQYFANIGQINRVPIILLSTDGTPTSCVYPSCDDTEQTLDMTQALGMAPGLASLVMYIGSTDTAIFSSMVSHNPLPTTIGCSWGWTPADPNTLNPYWVRMMAQGQTFFVASGDDSTWTQSGRAAAWPADSPYVVSVGGTNLITTGPGGSWQSETAWSHSGGGISPNNVPIPPWQTIPGVINTSNNGSRFLRNGPDVAANANFTFYVCANRNCTANRLGGTSFAAPMWAGYIALANQQTLATHQTTLGFISHTLYYLGASSVYSIVFHDIIFGQSGSFSAVPGYDLVTGWGSMKGPNLINFLAYFG
ncbi:Pseudomonalisin [Legionella sp. PC1000]|nr:Pseudomonalisin [Legionella sp. PC1000]